jgi:hypothetical protein
MFEETIRLGAQGRRNDIVDNVNDVDGRPTGNSKAYTLRRLAKDFPELSAKVERGEMTANAAAIKAGFRKVRSPLEQVEALIPKLSPAEKRHLLSLLQGSI